MSRRAIALSSRVWPAAAVVVCGVTFACTPSRPPPLRVVERLVDRQQWRVPEAVAEDDAALARGATLRWNADDIRRDWARVSGPGGTTRRSPRLAIDTVDDLEAIAVTLRAGTGRSILLWNHAPVLTGPDYTRNRRDLEPRADRPSTVIVRTKDLRGDTAPAIRYLFLHVPDGDAAVESVAVVTTADSVAAGRRAAARVAMAGDIRDALADASGTIEWATTVPPGAQLRVGVHGGGRARVTSASGGTSSTLFDGAVDDAGWRDVQAPLPAGDVVLRFSSDRAGRDSAWWANPTIVAPSPGPEPLNVVVYVVDALRADRLAAYGSKGTASPFLDGLAKQSRVFRRAYSAASWTKPSVATLLTGLMPHTHRVGARYYTDPLPDTVPTLQAMLRGHGYITAQFTANAFAGTLSNLDRGFDRALAPDAFADGTAKGVKTSADALNRKILPWLDSHAAGAFFVYVQSLEPHGPRLPAPPGSDPLAVYDGDVRANDRAIERLYNHLVELGIASRTLFIVTADHGEAFGEHGQWGHGLSVYDEEVRVPLLVHWPGAVQPAVVDEPVSVVDLVPTILEYARIPFDADTMDGRSLVPRARSTPATRPVIVTRFVYPEDVDAPPGNRSDADALVDFPWKLIAFKDAPGGRTRYELYDLMGDPSERRDRAAVEAERTRKLSAVLALIGDAQDRARARFVRAYGGARESRPRIPTRELVEQLKGLGYIR